MGPDTMGPRTGAVQTMHYTVPLILWASLGFLLVVSARAGERQCRFCDHEIRLSPADADCLERRMPEYLETRLDFVIVSTAECDRTLQDNTRIEDLPSIASGRIRAPSRMRVGVGKRAFLLSRFDARCLYRRLQARQNRTHEFETDLSSC